MNRVLTDGLLAALRRRGVAAWIGRKIPMNDGGVSLGQSHLARLALASGAPRLTA